MKIFAITLVLLLTVSRAPAETPRPSAPIKVMVLGTYHFDNPGHDLHNMKVDDVLTPAKQAELADVATRLARFQPTQIAVEAVSERSDLTTAKFDGFTPEVLTKNRDERVQIAFRLAAKLGQKSVYGIDEQSDTIDYFPFDKVDSYAKAHGKADELDRMHHDVEQMLKEMEAAQRTNSIAQMLTRINAPARIASEQRSFYYALLSVGQGPEQPGADLNAAWYLRNAKIFAKLTQIAQPGARVLVVFGFGHAYWLRHFVQNTPGFELIEPREILH